MADQSERRGFTSGPWVAVEHVDGQQSAVADVAHMTVIAEGNPDNSGRAIAEADACLIAAAPDLYEALRQAVDYKAQAHEPDEPWWMRDARAALAKADGRETGGEHG